jgi:hypothetical protein
MTMFGHLSRARLVEVAEGLGSPGALRHLADCSACRKQVEAAQGALGVAHQADIPEPSPLYWDAFRRQVGTRIASEVPARRHMAHRLLPTLAAMATVVALGLGLAVRQPRPVAVPSPAPMLPAWSALPSADDDVGLIAIEAMAPSAEDLNGAGPCHATYDCLGSLSDEESVALAQALREELGGRAL